MLEVLASMTHPNRGGPGTIVYFTQEWDVDPGETGTFPTKWMNEDGRSIHLVFSGNDSFSVRQATLGTEAPTTRGDSHID